MYHKWFTRVQKTCSKLIYSIWDIGRKICKAVKMDFFLFTILFCWLKAIYTYVYYASLLFFSMYKNGHKGTCPYDHVPLWPKFFVWTPHVKSSFINFNCPSPVGINMNVRPCATLNWSNLHIKALPVGIGSSPSRYIQYELESIILIDITRGEGRGALKPCQSIWTRKKKSLRVPSGKFNSHQDNPKAWPFKVQQGFNLFSLHINCKINICSSFIWSQHF